MALPTNIRLGWKVLAGTNTLAYYGNPQIAAVISFMVQAHGVNLTKSFWSSFNSYKLERFITLGKKLVAKTKWSGFYIV